MRKLRWGILSTGTIAKRFAKALAASETGVLVAVASRSATQARAFAVEHGAVCAFGSYGELLADENVEAVYIATPHPFHAHWCVEAARAGKHILCEKPVAMNLAEATAVIEEVRARRVFFMEAFMYRCHPQTALAAGFVRAGEIGAVRSIEAVFSFHVDYRAGSRLFDAALGGGGILDVGCYAVSAARLMAGAAAGFPGPAEPLAVKGCASLHPAEGTDVFAKAVLEFPGGVLANVTAGVQLALPHSLRVDGSEGSLTVTSPWFAGAVGAEIRITRGADTQVIPTADPRDLYAWEIDTVAARLGDLQAPEIGWDDTLGNMRVLDAWRAQAGIVYASDRQPFAAG